MIAQILTAEQLAAKAPAIFAAHASDTMSSRYGYVPTMDVIGTLALDGWQPTFVGLKKSRTEKARMFGSHTLRLRHLDSVPVLNGHHLEIVLRNAHDGTSAVQFHAGVFRLVCANGLTVCDSNFGGFTVRHNAYAVDKVRDGIAAMMAELPQLTSTIEKWQSIKLERSEQLLLAESAARLRWIDGTPPVDAPALLMPRRAADTGTDLWSTFNVLQEHITKGGDQGVTATGSRVRTRAITGGDVSHRLNKELWALAEGMAKLKA